MRAEMSDDALLRGRISPSQAIDRDRVRLRQAAWNRQPRNCGGTSRQIGLEQRRPRPCRHPDTSRRTQKHERHRALHDGNDALAKAAGERHERLMHDQIDCIAAHRSSPQPETERQVHRAKAVAVWHPLDDQTPWCWKRVE
jgi:hypothetical protein